MKTRFLSACAAAALPVAAGAQSITVVPALAPVGVTAVPVDNPWALLAVALAVAAAAWFGLRKRQHRALLAALLGTAVVAGMLWYSPELRAQLPSNNFTNPAGETRPIVVAQVVNGGNIEGFVPGDFTNASGVPMKITAIQEPTLAQCFPSGFANLVPPGAPPAPQPNCAVGNTIAPNAVCRVDVETICRTEAAASATTLTVTPASLAFDEGGTDTLTVTNTGAQPAQNVQASIPAGSGLSVASTTCTAVLAPAASCTIDLTAATAEGPTSVVVFGDNTNQATADVTVDAVVASGDVGAYHVDGSCGVLGVLGPGFTLTAGPGVDLPAGTTILVNASGVANAGVFSVTGGTATVSVLSPTSRLITLTSPLAAGATLAMRTTLSITVAFTLNGNSTLPVGYTSTGGKAAGSVTSTLVLCSAA